MIRLIGEKLVKKKKSKELIASERQNKNSNNLLTIIFFDNIVCWGLEIRGKLIITIYWWGHSLIPREYIVIYA